MKKLSVFLSVVLSGIAVQSQTMPQTRPPAMPARTNAPVPPTQRGAPMNRGAAVPPGAETINTNANNPPAAGGPSLSITNALSTMAPLQAQKVVQVQRGLVALQSLAPDLGNTNDHIRKLIEENSQVQEQVKVLASQIQALAEHTVKPSDDMVERLTEDLVRAYSTGQLSEAQQLVIATTINSACNSRGLSLAQVDRVVATGMAVMQTAGVSVPKSHLVACDLHAIAFEVNPTLAR